MNAGGYARGALLAAVLALGAAACSSAPGAASGTAPTRLGVTVFPGAQRQRVPALTAATLAGPRIDLRTLTGRAVLVINVWASWCSECRGEAKALASVSRAMHAHQVHFLGIDEQDDAGAARSFAKRTHMNYPHLIDTDGTLLAKIKIIPSMGIPSTVIIDRRGRMAARIIGAATRAQLTAALAAVQDKT